MNYITTINNVETTNINNLIYNLLFDYNTELLIDFNDYCNYDKRLEFKNNIRNILKKGKVNIIEDKIIHTSNILYWKLIINK